MRPKQQETTGAGDLFRARLDQIINLKHELAQLAGKMDWEFIDGEVAPLYSDKGRPAIATRFVIGLLLLKHIYGLSDEAVCERWIYDPYFQYFTGEEFFRHAFPHERSDLSHWRQRLGDKLELLLAESLRIAHQAGALRTKDLARVTVDTTVQPKAISFPTDAKLLHAAINGLNRLARKHGVRLRQSYRRIAKRAAMMAGRYAHAKQFKRHHRQLRILRTRLGRIIRDIRRKIAGCVIRRKAATDSDGSRPSIPIEAGHPGEPGLKVSMSAIESRTRPPLRPCKGRSDARRESADAEGSRSSEIEARPWRERAADRHHDRAEPVDGRRVSASRRRYRHHLADAGGTGRGRAGAAAVHTTDIRREAGMAAARLVPRPQGAEAARRDATVAVGGVPGRAR